MSFSEVVGVNHDGRKVAESGCGLRKKKSSRSEVLCNAILLKYRGEGLDGWAEIEIYFNLPCFQTVIHWAFLLSYKIVLDVVFVICT